MPDPGCRITRLEISAYVDGATDPRTTTLVRRHIEGCRGCTRYMESMRSVKRAVSLQPAEDVPDLHDRIMERVAIDAPLVLRRRERQRLGRVAAVAAVASILFFGGAATLWRSSPPEVASASEISGLVRTAARSLDTYRATYEITERGWHPSVGTREFVARVWFDSPESFRLRVRDLTAYPEGPWPENDVDVVASAHRWSIAEPSTCPVESLPMCGPPQTEQRTLVQRQPFDGTTALPTDIVLPIQTLATSERFSVVGRGTISGHDAYQLALTSSEAQPMIDALQVGGSWRAFSPDATVLLWIDRDTWFPLMFSVTEPGDARPGLVVRAASFDEPSIPAGVFSVPLTGIVKNGSFDNDPNLSPGHAPTYVAGLERYRSGRTANRSVVLSYAKGMTWLKITYGPAGTTTTARPETSEPVRVGDGIAYYRPADGTLRRSLDMYGPWRQVRIETNLGRAELLRVAGSTGFEGRTAPYPEGIEGATLREIEALGFAEMPRYVPAGYEAGAAYTTVDGEDVTGAVVYFRRPEVEYDGVGIRLTQVAGVRNLAPSSETFEVVRFGDVTARWSAERGELEWIDDGTYRSIAAPSVGLAEIALVARSLG